ncbi:hypothetical protein BH711_08125 [Pseudomonas fluorescens]|jgi:hypothetical protein|nr:hypothetical protein BH711_08125 [Pseudomonas fluorescens]
MRRTKQSFSLRVSSRKLEHGLSSPTVDKLIAISDAMGVSPLTLFTLTLSVNSGQPIDALVQRLKADIADLETRTH